MAGLKGHWRFEPAGTAEVLRAAQRDELMIERLQKEASQILLDAVGNRRWMEYRNAAHILAKVMYSAFTTMTDCQTLGEEYTGMVQVDKSLRNLPSKKRRLLALVLDCFGNTLILRIITNVERKLRSPSSLTTPARACLLEALAMMKSSIAFISHFHRAIFYWTGDYYYIAKRLTGIRNVLVRRWLKDRSTMKGFRILSVVTLLHLLGYTLVSTSSWVQTLPSTMSKLQHSLQTGDENSSLPQDQSINEDNGIQHRCSLCLEQRIYDTATPCGHVFCWSCIAEWLQTRGQCPLCRELIESSRLIPLRNFHKQL